VDLSRIDQPENVTPAIVNGARWSGALQRARQLRPVRAIVPHVPMSVRRMARRFASRGIERLGVDTSEVVSFLRPIQRVQTAELARRLGREFPEWTTLYGDCPR
jgi:hypothetical protein